MTDTVPMVKPAERGFRQKKALRTALTTIRQSQVAAYVIEVVLYGSFARGNYTYYSDVDLLLVLSEDIRSWAGYAREIRLLKSVLGEEKEDTAIVDLQCVVGEAWRDSPRIYYSRVRKEGMVVWH